MRRLSLRARVLLIFSAVTFAAFAIAAVTIIGKARKAVHTELGSSMELAKRLVHTVLRNAVENTGLTGTLRDLSLQFQDLRHVRITVYDSRDRAVPELAHPASPEASPGKAPEWFARLIRPEVKILRIVYAVHTDVRGFVLITPEPDDEIAEVWSDVSALAIIGAAAYFILLAAIYLAVGQALAPLGAINKGLEKLRSGDYGMCLPPVGVPDLASICQRIDALSAALAEATRQNERLNQKLILAQDNERKKIALDLHDEFGPCLFGITVDASFIEEKARTLDIAAGAEIAARARAISEITERMQKVNRDILNRLRPMALDHVSLPLLLTKLVSGFQARHRDIEWQFISPAYLPSYGESVDLTVYRLVQECLTNAVRHASPRHVSITIELTQPETANGTLCVKVSDDGCGIEPGRAPGLGLTGMSERIRGLGGRFTVDSAPGEGTVVTALIPVQHETENAATARAERQENMCRANGPISLSGLPVLDA